MRASRKAGGALENSTLTVKTQDVPDQSRLVQFLIRIVILSEIMHCTYRVCGARE